MNPDATPAAHVPQKLVQCPNCHGDSVYASTNAYRPFCSERCKSHDFGAWASEHFRVASAQLNENAANELKLQ